MGSFDHTLVSQKPPGVGYCSEPYYVSPEVEGTCSDNLLFR